MANVTVSTALRHTGHHRQDRLLAVESLELRLSSALSTIAGVRYNVDEVFGELIMPLVTANNDLSFLNRLQLNASGRYVDNAVNGGFFAYAGGAVIAPIADISFRGNYTNSFRAPAITELFAPQSKVFTSTQPIGFASPSPFRMLSTGKVNHITASSSRRARTI